MSCPFDASIDLTVHTVPPGIEPADAVARTRAAVCSLLQRYAAADALERQRRRKERNGYVALSAGRSG